MNVTETRWLCRYESIDGSKYLDMPFFCLYDMILPLSQVQR
jgi:hypothetical protein